MNTQKSNAAAPLAMVECNHSVTDATLGLQWHVVGMYAPSFFTGTLIARFGVEKVIGAGFALLLASAAVNISGITVWHFWIALVLLGVGWNFAFIGATAMVTQCHRPHERNRVQSFDRLREDFEAVQDERQKGAELAFARWRQHAAANAPKKTSGLG